MVIPLGFFSAHLTITVLYRLWFLIPERGFRRATRRLSLWSRRLLWENELPRRVLLGNSESCEGIKKESRGY
jgi:hypothetical protein